MTSSIFHRYSHFLMLWCFFIDKLLGKLWNFSRGVTFSRITRYTLQNHALFVSTIIDYLFIAQKMRFSIKEFFSKCDQIRRKNTDLVTFNLMRKSLMEKFIFCAVVVTSIHYSLTLVHLGGRNGLFYDFFCFFLIFFVLWFFLFLVVYLGLMLWIFFFQNSNCFLQC